MTLALPPAATLAEYVGDLRRSGARVCRGSAGTYWVASTDRVLWRLPTFQVGTPSQSEIDDALTTTGTLVASYLVEPSEDQPANAWVYLSSSRNYSLRMLAPPMQRNVRRAMRELTITPVGPGELLAHGRPAFCDTRRRNGLDDGTDVGFRRYFASGLHRPGQSYLAAWRQGQLAAFLTIVRLDDWVELCCFSTTSMLWYRPNDALMYAALSAYLADERCRVVSYGVSSIQAKSKAAGLHRFKRKVGFDAIPVHRTFVFHPSIRRFAHRLVLSAAHTAVNGVLRVQPRNRMLKKLGGMLACMLGSTRMMPAAEPNAGGARPAYGTSTMSLGFRKTFSSSEPLVTRL